MSSSGGGSQVLKKIYDNFEEVFCSFCMFIMVACLSIQVVIRVVAGSSLAWSEELSRYSFIWTVYMGAALMAKHNGHVRITAQFIPFSLRYRLVMRAVADIVWIGFTLYIAWQSWVVIRDGMAYPEMSPTLHIMKYWIELIIPAGFVITAWRIVEGYIKRYRANTLFELVEGDM
jgi:TRAP-type C4-dicarboxylate transport system permease small subunit